MLHKKRITLNIRVVHFLIKFVKNRIHLAISILVSILMDTEL